MAHRRDQSNQPKKKKKTRKRKMKSRTFSIAQSTWWTQKNPWARPRRKQKKLSCVNRRPGTSSLRPDRKSPCTEAGATAASPRWGQRQQGGPRRPAPWSNRMSPRSWRRRLCRRRAALSLDLPRRPSSPHYQTWGPRPLELHRLHGELIPGASSAPRGGIRPTPEGADTEDRRWCLHRLCSKISVRKITTFPSPINKRKTKKIKNDLLIRSLMFGAVSSSSTSIETYQEDSEGGRALTLCLDRSLRSPFQKPPPITGACTRSESWTPTYNW